MTKRDVLSIAFKILGVVALMYTIVLIPNIGMAIRMLFQSHPDNYQSYMSLWYFINTLVWPVGAFSMGYILIRWGDNIANKIVKDDKPLSMKVTEDWDKRIFNLALKIIGVIWLIKGIPELIKSIGELIMRWYVYYYSISHIIGVIISGAVSLILGIYLIANGKYLIKLAFGEQVVGAIQKKIKRKLCKHCGKKLDMDVKVCSYCGTELSEDDVTYV